MEFRRVLFRSVIDNAAAVDRLADTWEDVLQPSLKVFKGDAWVLSVPRGKRNGFYKLFQLGRSDPDWSVWQFDSFCNPHLPAGFKEEAEKLSEPEFEQRIQAERSEEHTSVQSLMRISYAVFCLKKKTKNHQTPHECRQ